MILHNIHIIHYTTIVFIIHICSDCILFNNILIIHKSYFIMDKQYSLIMI